MPNIEDAISRAIQDGHFDNLPGKGKPLKLDDNPHEDPAWRLANRILKNGGFSLPWIESLREIAADLEGARAALSRTLSWRQASLLEKKPAPQVELEWRRALNAFREQIQAVNQRILTYNLEVPSDRFQKRLLDPDREIAKITGS
jgi:DnaJ homolog subfamily C member 28